MKSTFIRIGVSACLLGQKVRYDGGHKEDDFVSAILKRHFELVPICPEVESGLGTPRESMTLHGKAGKVRLIGNKTDTDYTDVLSKFSKAKVQALERLDLSGFILKKNSPSCGLERVRVLNSKKHPVFEGQGIFASALSRAFPYLPIEDEGRLQNPAFKENWVERVFNYAQFQELKQKRFSRKAVVQFHTERKYTLLAHSQVHYQKMGRLVSNLKDIEPEAFFNRYESLLMEGMKILATRKSHTNVLEHMTGFLKDHLESREKEHLHSVIKDFHRGHVPLSVPLALIEHLAGKHHVSYLEQQTYLLPHPKELGLRNFIA